MIKSTYRRTSILPGNYLLRFSINRFKMSCLNDNTVYQEDDYLIILHRDECNNDKELEETIKLNLNGNYYLYQGNEFLDDSVNYLSYSEFLFKKINTLKTYIKSSDLKMPLNFNRLKEIINELFSLGDANILQKKDSFIKEIENLRLILTSNFENNIKRVKINIEGEKKIQKSIDFIYWLLKKNTGSHRVESIGEVPNFNINGNKSEAGKECKDSLYQLDSEINCKKKMESICTNDKITELVTSPKIQGNQRITNLDKDDDSKLSDQCSSNSEIESEKIVTETDSSDNSNMDGMDSDISQKSEPIINKNRMHKLYRRAGTVINEGDSSNISDTKLDENKYLKLIESYKNLTKTAEVKENISTNHK